MLLTRRELLAAAVVGGLGTGPAWAQASPPTEAPRISGEEAVRLVAAGQAVLVDVRNKTAWDTGHAEGALSIPSGEIATRLGELPKDKLIAACCT